MSIGSRVVACCSSDRDDAWKLAAADRSDGEERSDEAVAVAADAGSNTRPEAEWATTPPPDLALAAAVVKSLLRARSERADILLRGLNRGDGRKEGSSFLWISVTKRSKDEGTGLQDRQEARMRNSRVSTHLTMIGVARRGEAAFLLDISMQIGGASLAKTITKTWSRQIRGYV